MNALDDSANTDRCTLYEDSANFLKDERFPKTEYQTSAKSCTFYPGSKYICYKDQLGYLIIERRSNKLMVSTQLKIVFNHGHNK